MAIGSQTLFQALRTHTSVTKAAKSPAFLQLTLSRDIGNKHHRYIKGATCQSMINTVEKMCSGSSCGG